MGVRETYAVQWLLRGKEQRKTETLKVVERRRKEEAVG